MQNKGKKFKKGKPFAKKVGATDLEIQEIEELQKSYDQIDIKDVKTFGDFPLSKKTLKGLKEANYKTPTPIQRQAIPYALQGKDILGAAITGSGKTLAFLIPILENLFTKRWTRMDGLGALILTPTRELAYQIYEAITKVGKYHDFSCALIIGGQNAKYERNRIDQINIIVATPGRFRQHIEENSIFAADNLQVLVLDEADRCLDMKFEEQINAIVENLPLERQTLLFSATQTRAVQDLARLSLTSPVYVAPHEQSATVMPDKLQQNYVVVNLEDKITFVWSFIRNHLKQKSIIFLSTCKQVKYVYEIFKKLRPGASLLALYGTLSQQRRMAVYNEFVEKHSVVLFATDIASRGLDFPAVNWVIQLDCPEDETAYIHRAGRSARHKAKGESLLVLLPSEEQGMLEELKKKQIPIEKITVDPKRLFNPKAKMEAFLAKDLDLKATAKRAFVQYFKCIAKMRNKKIFNVDSLDPDLFAQSLGLEVTPRIRYFERQRKLKQAMLESDSEDDDEEKPPNKLNLTSIMAESDSEDDFLTIKQTTHEIPDEGEDLEDIGEVEDKKKKDKVITKAAVAKRLGKKKIIPNRKVVFDEEGNAVTNTAKELQSELAKEYENSAEGGIDIEKAKRLLREEDKFDRQRFKQIVQNKHKETKKKQKKKNKAADSDEDEVDEFQSGSEDEGPDLSWLPDPDKVYNKNDNADESAEEMVHRPPEKLVTKKVGKRKINEESTNMPKQKKTKKQKTKELVEDLSLNDAEMLAMKLLAN